MLLGARIYEPASGRFLSLDPILAATNQYAYTSGNPVLFTDSTGLWELTRQQQSAVGAAAAWAIGAGVFFFNPPAAAIALWLGAAGASVMGGVVLFNIQTAFSPVSAPSLDCDCSPPRFPPDLPLQALRSPRQQVRGPERVRAEDLVCRR